MRLRQPRPLDLLRCFLVTAPLALGACALPGGPPMTRLAPEINATLDLSRSVLGPGDTIEVRFAYADPTWDQEVLIQPDGFASFKGVDKVRAGGLLPEQLDEILSKSYAQILDNPSLSVVLVSNGPRYVHVMGEVELPQEIALAPQERLTLVEAIARAGGYDKDTAHLSSTLLVRWDPVNGRQMAWKFDARPKYWGGEQTIFLQPFDLVFVPNMPVDNVAIWINNYIRRLIPLPFIPGAA
jgi:polysaccharide export outer membrane protein